MKFEATVTFPGEPGEHICLVHRPGVECEALNNWPGSMGTTGSLQTLHLFECEADDDALCGSHSPWPDRALHFATAGKKYKVCLKCRRLAEGGE